ncbi:MAG: fatty acid desaturase [Cyanobacteria bacterium P01_D01_bin.105]
MSSTQLLRRNQGIAIAMLIILTWTMSIAAAFAIGADHLGMGRCLLLTPWFTFLYTGLFVTGHDAMHNSVSPNRPRLNRALGELALFLYGLIPYDTLYTAHSQHHQHPASHRDPDFHNGYHSHPLLWYLRFMRSYWTWRQTLGLIFIYNSLHRIIGVPEANLLVFWAVPSLLSSMQLFFFGTYLVHRKLPDTYSTALCSNSHYWPWFISLITCYHFGYHREHHAFPEIPWWQLPRTQFNPSQLGTDFVCTNLTGTDLTGTDYMSTANHKYTNGGRALATISKPLAQRDRTRLNK